ncbi:MAG: response regulator, partial [Lachnospiraceae bacterium]|nr:response regulator [Lachnospiraceae bacterium]
MSKLNIAVVDDEEIIRRQVKGLIEKQGTEFDVEVYASGEALLCSGKSYDMIFLDIQLDGMNGIET